MANGDMNLKDIKKLAIPRLKNREDPKQIAEDLNVSSAILEEWLDAIPPSEIVNTEINAIAIAGAYDLMMNKPRDEDELKVAVVSVAVAISEKINARIVAEEYDFVEGKALNQSADTVAKLWNAIFGKGNQIAVINTNTEASDSNVVKFVDTLKN